MQRVLEGVRVLDLSRYIAGPLCATIMADMGAEVLRIENVGGAEDRNQGPLSKTNENMRFTMIARNKKGVTLDLDNPKGRAIFRRMVEKSDVVIENYSPPVKEKLGLTYEELKKINDKIILVTISAFGTTGPYKHRLGFDHIIQAEAGTMSFTGFPENAHTRSQMAWVDLSTALHSTIGVLFALMHKNKTGEGQWVETALLDTAVSYLGFQGTAAEYQVLGMQRPKLGNASYYSFSDTFDAKDGSVMLALISDPLWRRLANLMGKPELADDPRFKGDTARYKNRHAIGAMVQEWMSQRTLAEVLDEMAKARIPCGPVNTVAQMVADPQVAARELFQALEMPGLGQVPYPRVAIRMSRTPAMVETPAPKVGEHNQEVYREWLGMSDEEIAALQAENLI